MAVGSACLLPPLSSGGASIAEPLLRFHTPLIEPDVQISRIRLSDKTSHLHADPIPQGRDPNGLSLPLAFGMNTLLIGFGR